MTTIMRMGFIPRDVINPENVHVFNNVQLTGQRRTDQKRRKKWRQNGEEAAHNPFKSNGKGRPSQ